MLAWEWGSVGWCFATVCLCVWGGGGRNRERDGEVYSSLCGMEDSTLCMCFCRGQCKSGDDYVVVSRKPLMCMVYVGVEEDGRLNFVMCGFLGFFPLDFFIFANVMRAEISSFPRGRGMA